MCAAAREFPQKSRAAKGGAENSPCIRGRNGKNQQFLSLPVCLFLVSACPATPRVRPRPRRRRRLTAAGTSQIAAMASPCFAKSGGGGSGGGGGGEVAIAVGRGGRGDQAAVAKAVATRYLWHEVYHGIRYTKILRHSSILANGKHNKYDQKRTPRVSKHTT